MSAILKGFDTRAEVGLRSPRAVSHNITPSQGGVVIHWGGGHLGITASSSHESCRRVWRGWQNYHMDDRGWSDIAYTGGVCPHGYGMAGRGAGVRTAAQGTNEGNDDYYAVVYIGGPYDTPTKEAYDAYEWFVDTLRKTGAGKRVLPHGTFHSTACPGTMLSTFAKSLDNKTIGTSTTPRFPLPAGHYFGRPSKLVRNHSGYYWSSDRPGLSLFARRLDWRGWAVDSKALAGYFTEGLEDIVKKFQAEKKLTPDGLVGPKTWTAAWTAPVT